MNTIKNSFKLFILALSLVTTVINSNDEDLLEDKEVEEEKEYIQDLVKDFQSLEVSLRLTKIQRPVLFTWS